MLPLLATCLLHGDLGVKHCLEYEITEILHMCDLTFGKKENKYLHGDLLAGRHCSGTLKQILAPVAIWIRCLSADPTHSFKC